MTFVQYHKDVFLPKTLENEVLSILVRLNGRVRLTRHAEARVAEKGVKLPERVPFMQATVVEVSKVLDRVDRFLIRFPQDERFDVCMSVSANGSVPTVYLNERTDRHATLNLSHYARG